MSLARKSSRYRGKRSLENYGKVQSTGKHLFGRRNYPGTHCNSQRRYYWRPQWALRRQYRDYLHLRSRPSFIRWHFAWDVVCEEGEGVQGLQRILKRYYREVGYLLYSREEATEKSQVGRENTDTEDAAASEEPVSFARKSSRYRGKRSLKLRNSSKPPGGISLGREISTRDPLWQSRKYNKGERHSWGINTERHPWRRYYWRPQWDPRRTSNTAKSVKKYRFFSHFTEGAN